MSLCNARVLALYVVAALSMFSVEASAQQAMMLKDINPSSGSNPTYLTRMGDKIYFNASDGSVGRELWKTDGSNSGTELVMDIYSGGSEGSPSPGRSEDFEWDNRFTVIGNRLFFLASDGNYGEEVWSSNGENSGTSIVSDIYGGSGGSGSYYLTTDGTNLWFRARNTSSNYEPYCISNAASNYNNSANWLYDLYSNSNGSYPNYMYAYNGRCYFSIQQTNIWGSSWYYELFYADTNTAGPQHDIWSGGNYSEPRDFCESNGTVFFAANNGTHGRELWMVQGSGNAQMVKDINPGGGASDPRYMTNVDGVLYFRANDGQNGNELWRSDGTPNGTYMVRNIRPFGSSSDPWGLTKVGDKLYFRANDGDNGNELWVSDGTQAGTRMVADIRTGSGGSDPEWMADVNGTCYFQANDGYNGVELWRVRGNGAQLVADIYNGSLGSDPEWLTYMNGVLYFVADDGINGRELWQYGVPPEVASLSPIRNELDVAADVDIEASFDQDIESTTVTASSFRIHSSYRGVRSGMRTSMMTDLALDPDENFLPGETIEVTFSSGMQNGFMIPAIPETYRFRVKSGTGPGEFSVVNTRNFGGSTTPTSSVQMADINGDGDLDLIVGTLGGPNTIYFNSGSGSFSSSSTSTVGGANDMCSDLAVGDIDADGDVDIVLALQGGYNAAYLNDGNGSFSGSASYLPFGPGYDDSRALALGDLNRDGFLDVVIANFEQPNLVHLNDGTGNFAFSTTVIGNYSDDTLDVAIGDIDADGSLDVVLANEHQTGYIYLNDGDGGYQRNELRRPYGTGVIFPVVRSSVALADFNGDGFLDIISGNRGQRNHIYMNDAATNFPTVDVELINVDDTEDVATADVDGDGDIDVIVANEGSQSFVYLNDGMGTGMAGPSPVVTMGGTAQNTVSLAMGDVDGDGDIDIASAAYGGQSYVVLNQTTTPTPPTIQSTAPTSAIVGEEYRYSISANGFPAPTFQVTNNPSWLTLSGSVLRGTPMSGDVGTAANIIITASNSAGADAIETFSITITQPMNPTAPMITSTAVTSAATGRVYTYTVQVTGFPTPQVFVAGNPSWLTLSGNTLSGTPGANDDGETGDITITATNGVGTDAMQTFRINVSQEVAPEISSTAITNAEVGEVYSYILTATGSPAPDFAAADLPAWLSLNGNVLTGIPSASDAGVDGVLTTGTITITASNGVGTDATQGFEITVLDRSRLVAPRITSVPPTFVSVGNPYAYAPSFVGNPQPTIDVTGLPAWLSWDGSTISGIPAEEDAGISGAITVTVSNTSGADAVQVFQLTVLLQRDVIVNTESVDSGSCALTSDSPSQRLWLLLLCAAAGAVLVLRKLERDDA